jgi:hypothetical protein
MHIAKKLGATLTIASLLWSGLASAQVNSNDEAARIQAIAEEAYIYGLPIVMNYAVMYDYAVDRQSPQFKAPFNHLRNIARAFTPEDKAVVTPTATHPTPSSGWTCGLSHWY